MTARKNIPDAKSADTYIAEPVPVKIVRLEERATEFGSFMTWLANPAPAEPEPEREDYS